MIRQVVRSTAVKVLRSEELDPGEVEIAAGVLRGNPEFGFPHAVRCDWCHETRTLFRDESEGPFRRTAQGWDCETCGTRAANQEIRF